MTVDRGRLRSCELKFEWTLYHQSCLVGFFNKWCYGSWTCSVYNQVAKFMVPWFQSCAPYVTRITSCLWVGTELWVRFEMIRASYIIGASYDFGVLLSTYTPTTFGLHFPFSTSWWLFESRGLSGVAELEKWLVLPIQVVRKRRIVL